MKACQDYQETLLLDVYGELTPTEREAWAMVERDGSAGTAPKVEEITFGALLEDNPKNLIHLHDQYYWAEDLT